MSSAKLKKWLRNTVLVLLVLALPLGAFAWYKFFRDVAQPEWITGNPEYNFLYGSIGAENEAGLPYWIVVTLPRIFGYDYLPGPGGYASLGLPWEEGKELPAGFSKKTIGFERIGFNCALCHATQYRVEPDETPTIVAGGGSHTADIQGLLEFFSKAANDPRFNADTILTEIDLAYRLSWIDRQLYKFLFIPIAKKRLIEQGADFGWADLRPRWGPGRDAPMNLTKFNFLQLPDDQSVDHTDFPAIWSLDARVQDGRVWPEENFALEADFSSIDVPPERLMLMNLAGDTTSFRSVLIDSAMGLGARSTPFFHQRMKELEQWLSELRPPKYPLEVDANLAAQGAELFAAHCASCHARDQDNRLGTVIPLAEVGTDAERTKAWTREAADAANEKVLELGVARTPMSKPAEIGYTAVHLAGIWLRAPYLHNGSVPNLRALLTPAQCRPSEFYRGYDVLDQENVGFVSARCGSPTPAIAGCSPLPPESIGTACVPAGQGWRFDVSERGNGNGGHEFGATLSDEEKTALLAHLKTL